MFWVDIAKFLRIAFFQHLCECFWVSYHGAVKSINWGACFFISHLHVLLILIKNFHEMLRYTNNSLLSHDKIISPLLELITCFRSQNMFWWEVLPKGFGHQTMSGKSIKTLIFYMLKHAVVATLQKTYNYSQFWWKTYTKHCTSNYIMWRVKGLGSPALCSWSGAFSFRVWFGKWNNVV